MPIAVLLTTIPTQQIEKLTTPSKWAVGGSGPPSTDDEDALVVAADKPLSSDLDKSRGTGMPTITSKCQVSLRETMSYELLPSFDAFCHRKNY